MHRPIGSDIPTAAAARRAGGKRNAPALGAGLISAGAGVGAGVGTGAGVGGRVPMVDGGATTVPVLPFEEPPPPQAASARMSGNAKGVRVICFMGPAVQVDPSRQGVGSIGDALHALP